MVGTIKFVGHRGIASETRVCEGWCRISVVHSMDVFFKVGPPQDGIRSISLVISL